jgi:hypothetical protein
MECVVLESGRVGVRIDYLENQFHASVGCLVNVSCALNVTGIGCPISARAVPVSVRWVGRIAGIVARITWVVGRVPMIRVVASISAVLLRHAGRSHRLRRNAARSLDRGHRLRRALGRHTL